MPDLSADRPPLLPDAFTEEDVEALATVVHEMDGLLVAESLIFADAEEIARAALAFLATRSRLLPPSAEHREEEEEFMVAGDLPDGTPWVSDPHHRLGDARQLAAMMAPGAVIKRRLVSAGPWVEVDPDEH